MTLIEDSTLTDVEPLLVLVSWRPLPYLLLLARMILEPGDLDVSSVNADEECRRVCIPRSRNVVDGAKRGRQDSKESREREREGCRDCVKKSRLSSRARMRFSNGICDVGQ